MPKLVNCSDLQNIRLKTLLYQAQNPKNHQQLAKNNFWSPRL